MKCPCVGVRLDNFTEFLPSQLDDLEALLGEALRVDVPEPGEASRPAAPTRAAPARRSAPVLRWALAASVVLAVGATGALLVTPIAILLDEQENLKKGIVSPHLVPDAAYVDPRLTVSLPPAVTAMTGVDAMVHAIEAYTSKHKKNPLSDNLAVQALAELGIEVPRDADGRIRCKLEISPLVATNASELAEALAGRTVEIDSELLVE